MFDPKLNKFLDHKSHEGHRGIILEIRRNGKEAIIKSITSGFGGIVKSGKMYLVKEIDETQYPETVREIKGVLKN